MSTPFPIKPSHEEWLREFDIELGLAEPNIFERLATRGDCLTRFEWRVTEWASVQTAKVMAFDSERWSYIVSREPTDHDQWRVSLFDEHGPFSHRTYATKTEAILEAANDGATPTASPKHAA